MYFRPAWLNANLFIAMFILILFLHFAKKYGNLQFCQIDSAFSLISIFLFINKLWRIAALILMKWRNMRGKWAWFYILSYRWILINLGILENCHLCRKSIHDVILMLQLVGICTNILASQQFCPLPEMEIQNPIYMYICIIYM